MNSCGTEDMQNVFHWKKITWRGARMRRELGIARCGLACCLCSENIKCSGCDSGECPDKEWCENRKCSIKKDITACYLCNEECHKGLLNKIKP